MKASVFIISYFFIISSWCNSSFANNEITHDDHFLEQEFKFLSEEPDNNPVYSIDEIDVSLLNLSADEKIIWKRSKEIMANNSKKLKRIEKIMSIDYLVASYPADILNPTSPTNVHLADDTNSFNYLKMAFYCAGQGDVNCLRILLDHKINVDTRDQKGDSLLIKAILANQIDTTRLLLARGANINLADSEGSTPLHLASIKGNSSIIQSLKSMGANSDIKDKFGKSSKDYARSKQSLSK
ncbi:Ankyrin repeats (3 copies) [Candidatus Arcanobacter lacustris]|uniref:Ankyrin repeats (3 copies) n=1 Tax=Candidatus Arcanibacter lacustris TaxID=1607817 RepID=A0A0F5MPA5_9RICK|nr:Ankyrin repeats (3 copies) [Candidatus Arcanobacter lacustris]